MEIHVTKALEVFNICKNGVDFLINNYKPISNEGRFEAIIFNSLISLEKVKMNYRDIYKPIQDFFFEILLYEADEISIALDSEILITLINSRYQFFDSELKRLYSVEGAFPGGIYHVFYEKPLNQNPVISSNFAEIMPFFIVLSPMIKHISENSIII